MAKDLRSELLELLTPEKAKKKSKKKYILVVDGKIPGNMVTKKEAIRFAKQLATTAASIELFSSEGVLTTNLDVTLKPLIKKSEEA